MKIFIAQLNPVVGDIDGNKARVLETLAAGSAGGADLVVLPELFLVGYPPKDLLERRDFMDRVEAAVDEIVKASATYPEMGLVLGAPVRTGGGIGKGLYNAALLIHRGALLLTQPKTLLPTYDVFDEARYFDPAPEVRTASFKNEVLGLSICEDAWNDPDLWPGGRLYARDPIAVLSDKGATLMINISASPFQMGKEELRHSLLRDHARRHGTPFLYVNQIGANDELVFDGRSLFLDGKGEAVWVAAPFAEEITAVETEAPGRSGAYQPQDRIAGVYQALVLGVKDYLRKAGFKQALVGLSGGIDSALTCCVAADAVGGGNVLGISMPSPYSSRGSFEDSRRLAENLGVPFKVIPIREVYGTYLDTLAEHFVGREPDITEENIQARIRGNILMAFSNKFGSLLLSTGNKSELAVGYCTLYGDMCGGLSVLADVPKTMVYELAAYVNREREIIPRAVIDKAPSAELRPDQTDQDTLPPYPVLDAILQGYIEDGFSVEEMIALGYAPETVRWVVRAIRRNEYKRRQAAPGLKVTGKAFGAGRRMPIAAKF